MVISEKCCNQEITRCIGFRCLRFLDLVIVVPEEQPSSSAVGVARSILLFSNVVEFSRLQSLNHQWYIAAADSRFNPPPFGVESEQAAASRQRR